MWKLKESAEGKSKAENAIIIKTGLENLQGKISGLKHIEVGINFNESEQAFDVVLYSEFESAEDLRVYQNHPEHLKVAEYIRKIIDDRNVVDYEF